MKIQKSIILLFIIFISISKPSNFSITYNHPFSKRNNSSFNFDSLKTSIQKFGWNETSLNFYRNYLVNSHRDLKLEKNLIQSLPDGYEKALLYSIILKKEHNFREMFDSLDTYLVIKPAFLPFYDDLIFAAQATRQIPVVEGKLEIIKKFPSIQFNYLKGLIKSAKGNFKEALSFFSIASKADSSDKNILYQLSYTYRNLGDYEKALTILQTALKLNNNDSWFEPKATIAEGSLLYLSRKNKTAETLFQKGRDLAAKNEDKQNEAAALIDLGILKDDNGDVDNARKNYSTAILIADKINDLETKALALSELGVSFTFTNNMIEAKQNYLESYDIYKRTGNTQRLSLLSNNLGKVFMSLFNYEAAVKYYQDGLQFAGDNLRSKVLNLFGLADAYTNLSDYAEALDYYRKAKELSSQIKDLDLTADIYSGLGALNYNLDNYKTALGYFSSADSNYKSASAQFSLADVYDKTGLVYSQIDSLAKAEFYFNQSYKIAKKNKDYFTAVLSACDLAELYLNKNLFEKSGIALSIAEQNSNKSRSQYLTAITEVISGKLFAVKNNFLKAKESFEHVLNISKNIEEHNLQIEAYYSLAKLNEKNNMNYEAERNYNSAVTLIEEISRQLFKKNDIQISYFTSKSEVYDSYTNFLLSQNKFEDAFNLIDRSRSRNTMQNLTNLKLEELLNDKKALDKIYNYEWAINSGIYGKVKIDSVKSEYKTLKEKLVKAQPGLNKYLNDRNDYLLNDIRENLSDNEYSISIFNTEFKTYIFLVTNKKFIPFEINIPRNELRNLISGITPYYGIKEGEQNYYLNQDLFSYNSEAAYKLYAKIFKPVFENIPENADVIISSSPEMISIPFEFLIKNYNNKQSPYYYGDKDYLIYHYNISYIPSAALYVDQKQNNLPNDGKVLLVGDPSINTSLSGYAERRGLLDAAGGLPRNIALLPLKYSADEISQISNIISADKILTGSSATETNFKENAQLSKIIHLSTHSFLYNKQPVIFFSNTYDPDDDGFLEAGEIVRMKLNSDLVVLSSCNSGLGEVNKFEGILGMSKAFFEAGAKSVVVSLWDVNDKYTAKFMELFYKELSKGYDKSQALRYAKINFIKEYSPNPYFWSAFVLTGNISKVQLAAKTNSYSFLIWIGIIILTSIIFVFSNHRFNLIKKKNAGSMNV